MIIDELDRCRPNYALDVLEVIKHIFNVEKITFIISADSKQINESIRHCYGPGIDSQRYLEKFFDLRLTFPEVDDRDRSVLELYSAYLSSHLPNATESKQYIASTLESLVTLSKTHNLSIRSFQKICQNFSLVLSQTTERHYRIPPVIALLCFCREIFPDIYARLTRGEYAYSDLLKDLSLKEVKDSFGGTTWFFRCIRWVLSSDLSQEPEEVQRFDGGQFRYSLERDRIFPVLAKTMVEPTTIIYTA